MFNLGAPEIIILLIIALLVFGPDRLPEIGANLGRGIRDFRRMSTEMTDGLTAEVQEVMQTVQDVTKEVQDVTKEISTSVQEVQSTVSGEVAGLNQVLTSTSAEVQSTLSSAMNPVPTATDAPVSSAPSTAAYVPPVGTDQREYIPSPRLFGLVGPGAATPAKQAGVVGPGAAFGLPAIVQPESGTADALAAGAPEAVIEEAATEHLSQPAGDLQTSALSGIEIVAAEPTPEAVAPETGVSTAEVATTQLLAAEPAVPEAGAPSVPQTSQPPESDVAIEPVADSTEPQTTEPPALTNDDALAPVVPASPPEVGELAATESMATTTVEAETPEAPALAGEAPNSEAALPPAAVEPEAPVLAGEAADSEAMLPPADEATLAATPTAELVPAPKPRGTRRPEAQPAAEPGTTPVVEGAPIVENESAS